MAFARNIAHILLQYIVFTVLVVYLICCLRYFSHTTGFLTNFKFPFDPSTGVENPSLADSYIAIAV